MHREQRDRAHDYLRTKGLDRALFASPYTVTWLTGFAPPVQVGPSPFAGGPSLVWYEGGQFTLIVLDSQAEEAGQCGCPVISYQGYTIEEPIAGADHLADALRAAGGTPVAGVRKGRLGVEACHLPTFLSSLLHGLMPSDVEWVSMDGWLDPFRAVKTAEELAVLRENFALTDIGHAAARQAMRHAAGRREIDIWATVQGAIEQSAGQRVPLGNDCVVNRRPANIGGWPLNLELRPGDSLIVDLGTRLHGYWSDSCATYYVSEPSAPQAAMHRTAARALEFAISLIKPGVIAKEIDRQVRQFIVDAGHPVYPHHTGHGVGVSPHEEPRLVPYNDWRLEAGMVIMLEPGIYLPGEAAVRLEDAVLVTADGAEILTHHDKSLPPEL